MSAAGWLCLRSGLAGDLTLGAGPRRLLKEGGNHRPFGQDLSFRTDHGVSSRASHAAQGDDGPGSAILSLGQHDRANNPDPVMISRLPGRKARGAR